MTRRLVTLLLAGFVLIHVPQASAIDIVTTFVGGEAPQSSGGGGNLTDIFNAAAARWAQSYPEPFTLRLYYGWAPIGSAGNHAVVEKGGEPARELAGLI